MIEFILFYDIIYVEKERAANTSQRRTVKKTVT